MKKRGTIKERVKENMLYAPWLAFAVIIFGGAIIKETHNKHKRYKDE